MSADAPEDDKPRRDFICAKGKKEEERSETSKSESAKRNHKYLMLFYVRVYRVFNRAQSSLDFCCQWKRRDEIFLKFSLKQYDFDKTFVPFSRKC